MASLTIDHCSRQFPFVLLPVRLETRFRRSPAGATELLVRFYPDTISIAASPAPLTNVERALGQAYWVARATSRRAPADDALRQIYRGAWNVMATRAGGYRAGFIARGTAPLNPDDPPEALQFPAPENAGQPVSASAEGLPDFFIVAAYFRDPTTRARSEVARVTGAPIPKDLVLGPDPTEDLQGITRDPATGRLDIAEPLRWLVDFDAAVAVGMGVRLPVPPPFNTRGFDRLLAFGARAGTPATAGGTILETLFSKHRDTVGLSFLAAGTPTNNTEKTPSGWSSESRQTDELFELEHDSQDVAEGTGPFGLKDGARFADLFGLPADLVQRIPGAGRTDIAEALSFNTAAAPGTVADFVREYLRGLVDATTADAFERFFVTHVTGRGLYPAFRVERQPYGVVLTSAWSQWKAQAAAPASAASTAIVDRLLRLLAAHRPRWETLAERAPHAALPASDPFQRLLGILGLLASSAEFVSRKAVSDEFLKQRLLFGGAAAPATQAWLNTLGQSRQAALQAIDFPSAPGPADPLLAFLVLLERVDEWKLPLVDADPTRPLSESNAVAAFDGTRNYLAWLAAAPADDIKSQRLVDAEGSPIHPPTALLYVVLRHALLAALERSTLATAHLRGQRAFAIPERDPLIANIGEEQHVLRQDILNVDASRLRLSTSPERLVDWLLRQARTNPASELAPVASLAEVQQALASLASLPTARLERLLAEHIDVCSYRLDAWVTGLYAHRLTTMRQQADVRGLFLGAYGWLENVRPPSEPVTPVSPGSLPTALQTGLAGPVFEDPANGGYIHAPSAMQAAAAAVLRNGYLSHADSNQPLLFSVNLSSARMRTALQLADGVRNGQPLGALLGYEFERGLHERHAGVELDEFIYRFRDRFPLVAGRLTDPPPNTPAEVIEARHVVDGLALLQVASTHSYPYGVSSLPAAGTPQSAAIQAEVDRLKDSSDAISDLLLAESVYQTVQGNTPRVQAALQALTAPEAPPEPEVLRTPRSGRLLSFKISVALDPDGTVGWNPQRSPRSVANAPLNDWLARQLPRPDRIQWTVQLPGGGRTVLSFADLRLEPIDLVLMSGSKLGDLSSELERYLVRHFRTRHNIPNSVRTVTALTSPPADAAALVFDWAGPSAGAVGLAQVQPVLDRWRRLITQTRAMHAGDWRRAAGAAAADAADPTGCASGHPQLVQFADLTARLDHAREALEEALNRVRSSAGALAGDAPQLEMDPSFVDDSGLRGRVAALQEALSALELFGLPEAAPVELSPITSALVRDILGQATSLVQLASDRLQQAGALRQTAFMGPLPPTDPARATELARRNDVLRRNYLEAGRLLLGSSFCLIPLYRLPSDQIEEIQALASGPPLAQADAVERWLHSNSRVRPRVADLLIGGAASRWLGQTQEAPTVLQLPSSPGLPWIGLQFDPITPPKDWLSMLLWNSSLLAKPAQAGLLIDNWTETVPAGRETTGVAFQYNRPNATAPHAVLVAVPASSTGLWTWDELADSVHEALDLAKIRAVEPEALIGRREDGRPPEGAYFQTLPAILFEMTRTRFASTDFANIQLTSVAANA